MLRSGELAELTGVTTDLLRHYERIGILPPAARASNGYRRYTPKAVMRVRAVRRSVGLGFSLAVMSGIFAARDGGGTPFRNVIALEADRLRCLEKFLEDLNA